MNDFGVMEYFSFPDFFIIYKISFKKIKKMLQNMFKLSFFLV